MRYLYFNESIAQAIHAPRIHHALLPMQITYDEGFPGEILAELESIGHKTFKGIPGKERIVPTLTAIGRDGDKLVAFYDARRSGSRSISIFD